MKLGNKYHKRRSFVCLHRSDIFLCSLDAEFYFFSEINALALDIFKLLNFSSENNEWVVDVI